MGLAPVITLNNEVQIPQLGFGVFQVPDAQVTGAVLTAVEAGYRSIDTAAVYGNEAGVGEAIASSGIPRDELFVTTKLWNSRPGLRLDAARVRRQLAAAAARLPRPVSDPLARAAQRTGTSTRGGRSRSCTPTAGSARSACPTSRSAHLQRLFDETDVVPAVNQIELHPRLPQQELRKRARHARHRHRGVEPARAGRQAPGRHRDHWPRRASTARPRPRSCCAGTSSSATW